MTFQAGAEFASILFEKLETAPEKPYSGTFQKELVFRGLGDYKKNYKMDLAEIREKADNLHNIERNIYGNVIMLVTVFIAIFSLINVNINLAYAQSIELTRMLVFDFSLVGSLMLLVSIIRLTVGPGLQKNKSAYITLLVVALILLGAALVIAL